MPRCMPVSVKRCGRKNCPGIPHLWSSRDNTVVAALDTDETTAKFTFDGGEHLTVAFRDAAATPDAIGATVAERLAR